MIRWRSQLPDMRAAVIGALYQALCHTSPPPGAVLTARLIAQAVAAHAASFAPGCEPPYHDQAHQAEATRAMGWLCATAHRQGLLAPQAAAAGVLAMAGHDLQHDGSHATPGRLEARSADLTAALAARAQLDPAAISTIRRVILATDPHRPPSQQAADDLLCRLGHEADLFASLTSSLGWHLGQALTREMLASGDHPDPRPDSYAGRLALLRGLRPMTEAGCALGLADTVAAQIAAMATLGAGDPAQGAAMLDARPPEEARSLYLAALKAACTSAHG